MSAATTEDGAPRAAARLLELAARDAEQWHADAAAVLDDARAEAAQIVDAGRVEAERLVAEARSRADELRQEQEQATHRHQAELGELERLQEEYRGQIRAHLHELLGAVERSGEQHA